MPGFHEYETFLQIAAFVLHKLLLLALEQKDLSSASVMAIAHMNLLQQGTKAATLAATYTLATLQSECHLNQMSFD